MAAMRAWHIEVTLVAHLEQIGNARRTFDRGGTGEVKLGVAAKRGRSRLGQLDRITLVINVHLPTIHLVAIHIAHGLLRKVGR